MQIARYVLFVAIYALGSVAFKLFLDWYDTGRLSSDGWPFAVVGGALAGCLALAAARRLRGRRAVWMGNGLLGILGLDVAWGFATFLTALTSSDLWMAMVGTLFMMAFYFLMIAPFGAAVGLLNGAVLAAPARVNDKKTQGLKDLA